MRKWLCICILICFSFYSHSIDKGVIDSLRLQIQTSTNLGDKADLICDLAWQYKDSNPQKMRELAFRALRLATENKLPLIKARALTLIGISYENVGDYDEAIDYYLQSAEIDEKLGNRAGMASCYNNVGGILYLQGRPDRALDYFKKALVINRELDDKYRVAGNLNNIGGTLQQTGALEKAITYHQEALELYLDLEEKSGVAFCLHNLGTIHTQLKNFQKAINYYDRALQISKQMGNDRQIASLYLNLGSTYVAMGKNSAAEKSYKEAINISRHIRGFEILKKAYESLTDLHKNQGRYKQALEYHELYTAIKDSLLNEATVEQINALEKRFETKEKEQKIRLLEKQEEVARLELAQERTVKYAVSGGALLLVMLMYLLYRRHRLIQKQFLLERIKQHQEDLIDAIVSAQEEERKRISRELHDGLGGLLSAVRINLDRINHEQSFELLSKSIELVDNAHKDLRLISNNMMPGTLIRNGLVSALDEFASNVSTPRTVVKIEAVGLRSRLDRTKEIILYRVAQEAVNNAIKHANASMVNVQLVNHGDNLSVVVEDNGDGITENDVPSGMGMDNMRSRIEYLKGQFVVDSSPGKGTSIIAEVPL